jgi:hypothetical protein
MSNYAGFDTSAYPGDSAMQVWKSTSPYSFVGYYLRSDNHPNGSWLGTYPSLKSLGWGLAVLYVALPETSPNLSRNRGITDAKETVVECQAEGFPPGCIVYLDVEPVDAFAPEHISYYRGWIRTILDSGSLKPGTYCHAKNADALYNAAQQEYADAGLPNGAPSFWITKVDMTFDPTSASPTDSGVQYADIWQGRIDVPSEGHGGISLDVDWDVANSADPSRTMGFLTSRPNLTLATKPDLIPENAAAHVKNILDVISAKMSELSRTPNQSQLDEVEVGIGGESGTHLRVRVKSRRSGRFENVGL